MLGCNSVVAAVVDVADDVLVVEEAVVERKSAMILQKIAIEEEKRTAARSNFDSELSVTAVFLKAKPWLS